VSNSIYGSTILIDERQPNSKSFVKLIGLEEAKLSSTIVDLKKKDFKFTKPHGGLKLASGFQEKMAEILIGFAI